MATLSLFRFVGQYYNVKEDIDFRIAGGPTTSSRISDKPLFALSSIALGTLSASVLFLALWAFPRLFAFSGGSHASRKPIIDAGVFEPSRPMSPYFDETPVDEEPIPFPEGPFPDVAAPVDSHEEPSVTHARKSSAPMNLPALTDAEDRFLREFSFETSVGEKDVDPLRETGPVDIATPGSAAEPGRLQAGEPTEEEYKRRLNELLRG